MRLDSRFAGFCLEEEEEGGSGNVACVGVRAGLRDGTVGVAGSPMIS